MHFLQAILSMNYRQDMHMKFGVHWLFLRNCGLFFTPLYYSLSVLSRIIIRNVSWEKLGNFKSVVSSKFVVNV